MNLELNGHGLTWGSESPPHLKYMCVIGALSSHINTANKYIHAGIFCVCRSFTCRTILYCPIWEFKCWLNSTDRCTSSDSFMIRFIGWKVHTKASSTHNAGLYAIHLCHVITVKGIKTQLWLLTISLRLNYLQGIRKGEGVATCVSLWFLITTYEKALPVLHSSTE